VRLQKIFNLLVLFSLFSLGFILGSGNFPLIIFQLMHWFWLSSLFVSLMLLTLLFKRENNVKKDYERLQNYKKGLQEGVLPS